VRTDGEDNIALRVSALVTHDLRAVVCTPAPFRRAREIAVQTWLGEPVSPNGSVERWRTAAISDFSAAIVAPGRGEPIVAAPSVSLD
jgi:hypothetical protein